MKRSVATLLGSSMLFGLWLFAQSVGAQGDAEQQVRVEVVEIAGGRAYVTPGESAGVRRGGTVVLGQRPFKVIAASASSAILDLGGRSVKRGAHGTALVSGPSESGPKRLPPPRALEAWNGQWPAPRMPASAQHVKPVPLGPMQEDGRTQIALSLSGAAIVPLSGSATPIERGELRARLRSEPLHELPLRIDADVATQLWLASDLNNRAGNASRPPLRVRALELAYGDDRALFGALGRLRYASRTLGMLDGAKVQAPIYDGLTLSAFGGFVPDPLNGKPTTDASRFGAEVAWENLAMGLRPRVALAAHGSRFNDALDERKLDAFVDIFPGRSRIGSYAEVSLYDQVNPWGAPAQELSAAGANASMRFGEIELGGRLDMQRPERSRWLAAYLPAGWLCTHRSANPSVANEPCHGDDWRYLAEGDIGLRREKLALTLGATASKTQNADADQLGGFLNASFLRVVDQVHLDSSVMGSTGSLIRTIAVSLGLGSPLARGMLDLSLHYRPALTRYQADTGTFLEHTVGTSLLFMPGSDVDLSLNADAVAGRDVDVLLVQSFLTWRPTAR